MHISIGFLGTAAIFLTLIAPYSIATPVSDMVAVPGGGYRSKSNIHMIPAGAHITHVDNEIHVVAANGTTLRVMSKPAGTAKPESVIPPPVQSGWITYAYWLPPSGSAPVSSFTTSWKVPPVPKTFNGQLLYLFNALEGPGIVQPVLQYGQSPAGGGQFWAVASWYLLEGFAFFTPLVQVSPGQTLNGLIQIVGQSGGFYNYNTQFTNVAGTSLTVNGSPQFPDATETLEAYTVTALTDFPAGSTVFSGIHLSLLSGTPSLKWSHVDDTADGLFTTINVDGASNAVITITY